MAAGSRRDIAVFNWHWPTRLLKQEFLVRPDMGRRHIKTEYSPFEGLNALPEPIVRIVERVVEKIVIRQDPQCLQKLEQASRLISTATERLTQQCVASVAPVVLAQIPETGAFPTMAEVERAMIAAAYERSNRRPLEAARLLGIGKTTVYRKLRAMGEVAA